eukprot:scaffold959_cov119-Isochrysis_galbana.AAC.4
MTHFSLSWYLAFGYPGLEAQLPSSVSWHGPSMVTSAGGGAGGIGMAGGAGGGNGGASAQQISQPARVACSSEYQPIVPSTATTPSGPTDEQNSWEPITRRSNRHISAPYEYCLGAKPSSTSKATTRSGTGGTFEIRHRSWHGPSIVTACAEAGDTSTASTATTASPLQAQELARPARELRSLLWALQPSEVAACLLSRMKCPTRGKRQLAAAGVGVHFGLARVGHTNPRISDTAILFGGVPIALARLISVVRRAARGRPGSAGGRRHRY